MMIVLLCCTYYSGVRVSHMMIVLLCCTYCSGVRVSHMMIVLFWVGSYQQWYMNSSTACSVPSSPSFWSASHGELEHTPDTQSGGSHWTCSKDQLVHCLNLILSIGAPPPLYLPVLTCNWLCQLLAYNYLHHSRVQEPGNEATGTYELVWYHAILY